MLFKFINLLKSAFFRKKWNIAIVKISKKNFINLKNLDFIEKKFKKITLNDNKYIFFADPFPINNQLLLVEAMNKKNVGELILIDLKKNKIIKKFSEFKGHISFPFLFFDKKKVFLIPEISHWSGQRIYSYNIKKNDIFNKKFIQGLGPIKIKDPVIFKKNQNYYLFYNLKNSNQIEIATSKKLFGVFKKIKNNTKLNSRCGVRMAGALLKVNHGLYRISQNNNNLYGNGIRINKITNFNQTNFKEKYIRTLKFKKMYGPHTISFIGNNLFFDYYTLKFDLSHFANKLKTKIFN